MLKVSDEKETQFPEPVKEPEAPFDNDESNPNYKKLEEILKEEEGSYGPEGKPFTLDRFKLNLELKIKELDFGMAEYHG